jgi:ribosomal protein S1
MSPGDVVQAIVTRIEHYGLYLDHEGETILVLAPDVSDERPLDLHAKFSVGSHLTVKVLRLVAQQSTYKGTMVDNPPTEGLPRSD